MSNSDNPLFHIIDVLKHLVSTHVHWNMDMNKDDALKKLETAASDAQKTVADVQAHDVVDGVQDGAQTVADVVELTKDVSK